jgi:hypothetical protein
MSTKDRSTLSAGPKIIIFSMQFAAYIGMQQGDQIGRIFSFWAIVYLEKLFENFRKSPKS